ncbi:MAG: RluA family pseudouridine synthase [Thermodesulfovibrionales bacterium]|nr:RluA family pseudouridine synthase [Thermodesulfovibrionales bacterium]
MQLRALKEDSARRIDALVAGKTGISRSQVQRLIEEGLVTVAGKRVKPDIKVRAGDLISITIPERAPSGALIPEDIPIGIIYRDEFLVVVDKPPGMVVYPAAGHAGGTLMNALAFQTGRLNAVGGPLRPGVVHRLDKDTSGVMVVALKDNAYWGLIEQFRQRTVNKRYTAIVFGRLKGQRGEIRAGIGRSGADRKKMSVKARRAKEAHTEWVAVEGLNDATLVNIKLKTGRTHQIRVHFASIGHPVLGDRVYGKKTTLGGVSFPRQMLHAGLLGFVHPVKGEYMEFKSPLPEDMEKAISLLRGEGS